MVVYVLIIETSTIIKQAHNIFYTSNKLVFLLVLN